MSDRRVQLFESSVERLARILSQTYGIRVVFRHNRCGVDINTRTVYLPVVPHDASEELLDAIQGHMDHEVSHLLFTDFAALRAIEAQPRLFYTTNALEDPRVERLYTKRWQGAVGFLARSLEWLLRQQDIKKDFEEPGTGIVRHARIWDTFDPFSKTLKAISLWPQLNYNADHWFWRDVVEQVHKDRALFCEDLIREAYVANTTGDVVEIAREVLKRLAEPEQHQPPPEPPPVGTEMGDQENGEGDSDDQAGDASGDRDAADDVEKSVEVEVQIGADSSSESDADQDDGQQQDPEESGEQQQSSPQPGPQGRQSGQQQAGQAADDAPRGHGDDGASQPADQEDDTTGETSERGDQQADEQSGDPTGAGGSDGQEASEQAEQDADVPDNAPDESSESPQSPEQQSDRAAAPERRQKIVPPPLQPPKDEKIIRDQLLAALSEQIRQVSFHELEHLDEYAVYTTEGDRVEHVEGGDSAAYKAFMEQSRQMVSVLRQTMSRSLLATRQRRWQGNQLRGRVNPRALFHVPLGTSRHVFRHKVEAPALNTTVLLMVDHSASMVHGEEGKPNKMELATKTAVVLSDVLYRLGLPFAVYGFSTGHPVEASNRFFKASADEREIYTRWGDLWIGVYKDFDESWPQVAEKSIVMPKNMRINTYDGEALRYGAQQLLRRREERKILLWLNDGYPEPSRYDHHERHRDYAWRCAREVERYVELLAIGIMTDAVKHYYSNWLVVEDLKDLPGQCLQQLDELLRKGKKLRKVR